MAYVLKASKTYTDPSTNVLSAYGIVDEIKLNKLNKNCKFILNIYKDRTARVNTKRPVNTYSFDVISPDFDTYFSTSVLASTSIWTAIQNYLVGVGLSLTDIVVADWQVDVTPEP